MLLILLGTFLYFKWKFPVRLFGGKSLTISTDWWNAYLNFSLYFTRLWYLTSQFPIIDKINVGDECFKMHLLILVIFTLDIHILFTLVNYCTYHAPACLSLLFYFLMGQDHCKTQSYRHYLCKYIMCQNN